MELLLISDFMFLNLACLEAIDTISIVLGRSIIITSLKRLEIFSRPSVPQESLSFFGSLAYFDVTVKLFMSKLYCETSEMKSLVRTLGARSSPPTSSRLA